MGSGRWDADVYTRTAAYRKATGTPTFAYSATLHDRVPRSKWRVHETLDPKGVMVRESRDSDEHPQSRAIVVLFDVTGSMHTIPQTLQQKLPQLLGVLLRRGYVTDPQILFGAIGDATCDRVPLQIGQWESDNRMDTHLENLVLEGGGGGQVTESYELALYFMARHTAMDCWEKRGEKGYLFVIGDEMAYHYVKPKEVEAILGEKLAEPVPIVTIAREVTERFHTYYLLPTAAAHGREERIADFWRELLGQNVLQLDDPDAVCEVIALQIGLEEGVIDLDEGIAHLRAEGADAKAVRSASTVLAKTAAATGSIARAEGGALAAPELVGVGGRRL